MDSTADESPPTQRLGLIRLRIDAGLSQEALAEELGLSRGSIARYERGDGGAPHPGTCKTIAEFYDVPVRDIEALFQTEQTTLQTSSGAHSELQAGRGSRATIPFVGRAVGRAELEAVDAGIREIVTHYEQTGPSIMSSRALTLRTQVMDWLEASPRLQDRVTVYRQSAQLAGLLGYMAVNIGRFRLADAYCAEALHLADEAGDLDLQQWLRGTQAHAAYYEGNFDLAIGYARAGVKLSPSSGQAIRLLVNGEARSQSKLGKRNEAERAVGEGMDLLDQQQTDPGFTPCIAFEPYGYGRLAANAATAHVAAGDTQRVLAFTKDLDNEVESLNSDWSRALINLDVAATLLAADTPDVEQAMQLGQDAIEACAERPIRSVWQRAVDLRRSASEWSQQPAVADYEEMFRDWSRRDSTLAVADVAA